ncbi:hypothetical protein Q5741_15430 [Paenibacillus sp. JX-17]|uniref:DUF3784 domain-containing protein n=1 Tax=Paenibacillus lacisoli TaxID=3064525 RepID=A0ABT9CEW1_9BACL|nr:hypothetical protein [Paenibacillus sp. JX-17]MDO7907803.1 hypothetical protein [Paenibacillus sp. JX-17]
MWVARLIIIVVSLICFGAAYLLRSRLGLRLLTGYTGGGGKSEIYKRFARANGMMFMMYGVLLLALVFTLDFINVYAVFISFVVLSIVHIVVVNRSVRVKRQ